MADQKTAIVTFIPQLPDGDYLLVLHPEVGDDINAPFICSAVKTAAGTI
jgi:hypothetical protein